MSPVLVFQIQNTETESNIVDNEKQAQATSNNWIIYQNSKLDIVFDCATVPHARIEHYEIHTRFPRIEEFLKRKENNIWITTHGLIRDSVEPLRPDIYDNFKEKIVLVDNLFPPDEIPKWMDVPNSLTLIIACALAGGASKIIIFGLDGYSGDISKGVDSYYKKETVIKERQSALGSYIDAGINRDTKGFENRFPKILEQYRMLFGNNCEILNCSPSSYYTVLPKIKYSELEEVLNDAKSSNNK